MDKQALLAARNARYRRRMDLRVTTQEQARAFVRDVGFCFLFPIQGMEMPSLWDAVAGRVKKTSASHHGYEIERTWGWKDESLDKRWWYYGKLIRAKATLMALDFLPNFYALSENFGDYEHDYLEEYREGRLSVEARNIYDVLLEKGPMHTIRLSKEVHMASEGKSRARFDRALSELQVGLKVLPVGVAQAGAWRYAFIYDILARYYPQAPEKARRISREQARRAILDRYLRNVIYTTPREAARVFGWSLAETQKTAERLVDERLAKMAVKVAGIGERQLLTSPGRETTTRQ